MIEIIAILECKYYAITLEILRPKMKPIDLSERMISGQLAWATVEMLFKYNKNIKFSRRTGINRRAEIFYR